MKQSGILLTLSLISFAAAASSWNGLLIAMPAVWALMELNLPKPVDPPGYTLYHTVNMGMSFTTAFPAVVGVCRDTGFDSGMCQLAKTTSFVALSTASYMFQKTEIPKFEQLSDFIPHREAVEKATTRICAHVREVRERYEL